MNTDIRLDIGFWEHPKTVKLIRRLGLEGPVALQKLWLWATQNRPDGVLSGMDDEDIEIVAKWSGEGTALYDALTALRFIDVVDGTHMLHNWKKRNTWQAEAEARSEKARKGAKARWGKGEAEAKHQSSNAQTMPEPCSSNAQAMLKHQSSNAPLLSSPNQEEKKKNKNPPISPLGDGECDAGDLQVLGDGLPEMPRDLAAAISTAYDKILVPAGWQRFGGWYDKLIRQIRTCMGENTARGSPAYWEEHFNRIRGSGFLNTPKFDSKSIVWATKPETVGKIENGMWQGSKPEEGTLEGSWEFLNSLDQGRAEDGLQEVL